MTKLIKKFQFGGPTNHIYKLLEFLNKRGYDLGKYGVDGKWGKNTETAVKLAISDGLLSPESLTDKAITSPTAALSIKAQQNMYTTGFYRGESDPLYKNMKKVNELVEKAVTEGKAKIEAENQERAKLHKKKGVVRAEMDERMLREAKAKQEALLAEGYNLGRWGADGKWGNASLAAYDKAMADGWVYENGKLIKPASKLIPKSNSEPSPITSLKNTFTNLPTFSNISIDQLKLIYGKGPGMGDTAGTMLYHTFSPEDWSIPHTDGLKNQVAAAIAYNERLPKNQREKDSNGILTDNDGYLYVGYKTFGVLSGQSGNVNEQGTGANAASKIMGGLRYRINEDGSIEVKDKYGFNIVRDFNQVNSKGAPKVMSNKEKNEDPYKDSPWKGLVHDLLSEHSSIINKNASIWNPGTWFNTKGIQDVAENFGTRQGKVRENGFVFAPGEISTRLNL